MAGKAKARKTAQRRSVARSGRSGNPRSTRLAVTRASSRVKFRAPDREVRDSGGSRRSRPVVVAKPVGRRDLKEFRRLLEDERQRLTDELEAMEEHTPELEAQVGLDLAGSYDEDFADVATDTFEREKGLAIESSVQALLNQVEEALARLEEGTYGICLNCGRPIHPARLRAIPYAKLCIDCKAREERANGIGR